MRARRFSSSQEEELLPLVARRCAHRKSFSFDNQLSFQHQSDCNPVFSQRLKITSSLKIFYAPLFVVLTCFVLSLI